MSWIDGVRERLRPLFDRRDLQAEMDEELAWHFAREVERNVRAGMTPRAARRAARASMGGAVRPGADVRAVWRGYELGGLGHELRLAIRRLRRRPGFTAVATATLALGIGANTVIFSLVRSVLLRPLPYEKPDRLAFIWSPSLDTETWLSERELLEYRSALSIFADLAAYEDFEATLTEDGDPEQVAAASVTGNALPVLGIGTIDGRGFRPEEDLPGASPVAILGYDLWRRRYGGDEGIVGRQIMVDGVRHTVVGVLPRGARLPLDYRFERPSELFVPARIDETADLAWGNRGSYLFGRLDDGVSIDRATAEIDAVTDRWIEEGYIPADRVERRALSFDDLLFSEVRRPLMILMAAVGLVLLIACANVAHLLLARSEARRGEVAVAAALGASRGRLARQHLVENGLLATLGAVLGVGLAVLGLRIAVTLAPVGLIRMRGVGMDATVIGFAAALTIATTLIAGLVPALRISGVPLTEALGGTRGADRSGRSGVRRGLVALESALAVILVIGAALLGRSFGQLSRIELGFDGSHVLAAGLTLPEAAYPEAGQVGTFFRALTERVGRLPGVEAAAAVRKIPLGESIGSWTIMLEEPLPDPEEDVEPDWQIVTAGYFDALRLELRRGRFFTGEDRADGRLVAVISDAMAERYWPAGDPIGKRFHLGTADQPWIEIVGVAGDVRHNDVLEQPRIEMYLLHEQWAALQGGGPRRGMNLVVRTAGDPLAVLPAVQRELRSLDPSLPLANPRRMSVITGGALAEERFTTSVFGLFAALALVLAAVGLYGVTAYSTSRRTNELGIRLAMGARRVDVAGLVLRESLVVAGVGVGAGALVALGLTRLLQSQLYGVSAADPVTFVAVPLALLGVAGLAAYLPARRATRIDPVRALRSEG